ncbi:LysR family transcriptional regulator [Aeromonas schubertii]|uniref:LysR family transcriptional regulator n=1 Tax=Aeromonas schubertii TaxID=652 RepID=A0ABS7V8Y3_9GAMM|nr:LysR family transcriptional regulator [Aeromonas schubertii]MBZ6065535.1 LysR family transcriptional regulator [Aeromonas schubertii]
MKLKQWPPLNVLRGFEAAARLGSFHRAAEELHLTQSAISQQIRSLEEMLGQPLFLRQGRGVILTDAGADLQATTSEVLQQLVAGLKRLDQYQKPNQVILHTSQELARYWLVPRLPALRQCHPEIDLWLVTGSEPPDMQGDTIDLALHANLKAQADCDLYSLYQDWLLPVAAPAIAHRSPEERLTLHGEREMDWQRWLLQGGDGLGLREEGFNFSDPGLLLEAAIGGVGVALACELLARPALEEGRLLPLSAHRVKGPRWDLLIHRESREIPHCRTLLTWLRQAF